MTYQPYRITVIFKDGAKQVYEERHSTFRIMMSGVEGMVRSFGRTSADVDCVLVESIA